MRIRSIKPEFWQSETVARLGRDARLFFVGLWSLADDAGRFRANARYLAGQLFPYDDDCLDVSSRALASLSAAGLITVWTDKNGNQYGAVLGWAEHQKIDRPTPSKLPAPPQCIENTLDESSSSTRRGLVEASCLEQGAGSREQGTGSRESDAGAPLSPPEVLQRFNELRAAAKPNPFTLWPEKLASSTKFREFYQAAQHRLGHDLRGIFEAFAVWLEDPYVRKNNSSFGLWASQWGAQIDRDPNADPSRKSKIVDLTRGVAPVSDWGVVA